MRFDEATLRHILPRLTSRHVRLLLMISGHSPRGISKKGLLTECKGMKDLSRPVIDVLTESLYVAGLVDKKPQGKSALYCMSDNGHNMGPLLVEAGLVTENGEVIEEA